MKALVGATLAALAFASAPAAAQDHGAHGSHADHTQHADHTEHSAMEQAGPEAVLTAYRDALVALDLDAAGANFASDSSLFENGKPEGNWANYAEKHLGPELGHFHSFAFPTYDVEVRQMGHMALGEERYTYRIELHDGRVIEREGVATSVLHHGEDGWKITVYHSSSRAPRSP